MAKCSNAFRQRSSQDAPSQRYSALSDSIITQQLLTILLISRFFAFPNLQRVSSAICRRSLRLRMGVIGHRVGRVEQRAIKAAIQIVS